jgi:N-acetylglucosamine-6-phosphate deacetylase
VLIEGGLIVAVGGGPAPDADHVIDLPDLTIAPGFVDQHCHGGGGVHFTDGPDQARLAADLHASHGTTSVVASLVSAPPRLLLDQVRMLAPLVRDGVLAGLHLEGPWISHHHHGAHDVSVLRDPDPDEISTLIDAAGGALRMVTLAPELPGALAAITQFRQAGIVVAIGHTHADDQRTHQAIGAGASVATHLFNAMPGLKHREPGPVGALLSDRRVTVELIADGVHVHPDVLAISHAASGPDRVALVTDAMGAAGAADGDYRLGSLDVVVSAGQARVRDTGALAGSTLTLDRALQNAVTTAGWTVDDAITCLTRTPARVLRLADRGALAPGRRADLVALDGDLTVRAVLRSGQWVVPPGEAHNRGGRP